MVYSLCFLLVFLVSYSPFILAGKSFVWYPDGEYQHFPAMVYIGKYLRKIASNFLHGNFALPMFDLNIAWGGDILATLNYYGLGDPLCLLSALVPYNYTEMLFNFLCIFRMYLAGIAFYALCRYHSKNELATLAGSLIYVFSGFAISSAIRHPYFINPMIQLPLLLIGMDQIIKKKNPLIFILTVFWAALCGFYFLYMMTAMLGLYALIRFFDFYEKDRLRGFFCMLGRIVLNYLWGIGLSAVIFVPAVIGFLTSGRFGVSVDRNYLSYGLDYYITYGLRLISPPGAWAAMTLAAIVLPCLVLFIFRKRKDYRSLKILLLCAAVIFVLPFGGFVMNGFGYPSQRWAFGFVLLICYITVEMIPHLPLLSKKEKLLLALTAVVYAAFVLLIAKQRTAANLLGLAMLLLTVILILAVPKTGPRLGFRKYAFLSSVLCMALVMGNVSVNTLYHFMPRFHNYVGEFKASHVQTSQLQNSLEAKAVANLGISDGRIDSSQFIYNTGAVAGVPDVNAYWSMVNKNIINYLIFSEEYTGTNNQIGGVGNRTIRDELLSVNYFVSSNADRGQYVPYGYDLQQQSEQILIYKNSYALPWGYTYDSYSDASEFENLHGNARDEAMLTSVALEKDIDGVRKTAIPEPETVSVPYDLSFEGGISYDGSILSVTEPSSSLILSFKRPQDAELSVDVLGLDAVGDSYDFYLNASCGDVSRSARVLSEDSSWYVGRKNYSFNLGSVSDACECRITFPKTGEYELAGIELLALPLDFYRSAAAKLRDSESLQNISFGINTVSGSLELSEAKVLCVSIPYSKGWSCRIDGADTEVLKGNGLFLAVPVSAGTHSVEFRYCTPGLLAGACISVISLIAFIIVIISRKRRKNLPEVCNG